MISSAATLLGGSTIVTKIIEGTHIHLHNSQVSTYFAGFLWFPSEITKRCSFLKQNVQSTLLRLLLTMVSYNLCFICMNLNLGRLLPWTHTHAHLCTGKKHKDSAFSGMPFMKLKILSVGGSNIVKPGNFIVSAMELTVGCIYAPHLLVEGVLNDWCFVQLLTCVLFMYHLAASYLICSCRFDLGSKLSPPWIPNEGPANDQLWLPLGPSWVWLLKVLGTHKKPSWKKGLSNYGSV